MRTPFKRSKVNKAMEQSTEQKPSQMQLEQMKADTAFLSDIVLRMMANRPLPVCLNTIATVVNSIASHCPQKGKEYIADCLTQLASDIINDVQDVKEKIQ